MITIAMSHFTLTVYRNVYFYTTHLLSKIGFLNTYYCGYVGNLNVSVLFLQCWIVNICRCLINIIIIYSCLRILVYDNFSKFTVYNRIPVVFTKINHSYADKYCTKCVMYCQHISLICRDIMTEKDETLEAFTLTFLVIYVLYIVDVGIS